MPIVKLTNKSTNARTVPTVGGGRVLVQRDQSVVAEIEEGQLKFFQNLGDSSPFEFEKASEAALKKQQQEPAAQVPGQMTPPPTAPQAKPHKTRAELEAMTKEEVAEHAESLGMDVKVSETKAELIEHVVRHQRRA